MNRTARHLILAGVLAGSAFAGIKYQEPTGNVRTVYAWDRPLCLPNGRVVQPSDFQDHEAYEAFKRQNHAYELQEGQVCPQPPSPTADPTPDRSTATPLPKATETPAPVTTSQPTTAPSASPAASMTPASVPSSPSPSVSPGSTPTGAPSPFVPVPQTSSEQPKGKGPDETRIIVCVSLPGGTRNLEISREETPKYNHQIVNRMPGREQYPAEGPCVATPTRTVAPSHSATAAPSHSVVLSPSAPATPIPLTPATPEPTAIPPSSSTPTLPTLPTPIIPETTPDTNTLVGEPELTPEPEQVVTPQPTVVPASPTVPPSAPRTNVQPPVTTPQENVSREPSQPTTSQERQMVTLPKTGGGRRR